MLNISLDGLRKEVTVTYFQLLFQHSSWEKERSPRRTCCQHVCSSDRVWTRVLTAHALERLTPDLKIKRDLSCYDPS